SSDFFRERVAQAVEQEIAEEKQQERPDAEREQPLPVAERALGKKNLLIGDREMRERVQVDERLRPRRRAGQRPVDVRYRINVGRFDERAGAPRPGEQTAEQKERARPKLLIPPSRENHREDERVHQQEQQRIEERPEEAENRAAIARLELSRHQALDEPSISG